MDTLTFTFEKAPVFVKPYRIHIVVTVIIILSTGLHAVLSLRFDVSNFRPHPLSFLILLRRLVELLIIGIVGCSNIVKGIPIQYCAMILGHH